MNQQLLIILILFFFNNTLFGQIENDVNKVLSSKNFVAFKKYADNLSKNEKLITTHWESLRDLTNDFQEGVFIFEKSIPDKKNPSESSIFTYKVNLIATKSTIIYYELSEEKNKKILNEWKSYYDPIKKFKDNKDFDKLKKSFKNTFQSDLNEKELFIYDYVYGNRCGIVGTQPKGRQQIYEWIDNKDKTALIKWLKSTNTEKQVYAVEGLFQLRKAGVKLTDEELKIINFVFSKKGTVYTCSGCIHSRRNINDVIKEFKF